MLNFFCNIKNPVVQDEIDVYDFIDRIKHPDPVTKKKIEEARLLKSHHKTEDYQKLKAQLPCFTLNFTFEGKKYNDTIKAPTGFIYIDVDDNTNIELQNPLIFASWLSLSGLGRGILVKVESLTLNNFKTVYTDISKQLNIETDPHAGKATQYCVHSYDEGIYVNNDSTTYKAKEKEETIKTPSSVTYKKEKREVATEIGNNNSIKYNNIHTYDFNGNDYKFFEEKKEFFSKSWIPKMIDIGERNQTLFTLAYQTRAINPEISKSKLENFVLSVNHSRCIEPLSNKEVIGIVHKIENSNNKEPLLNHPRRIIFNPNSKLTAKEKRAITNKLNGQRRTKNTIQEIEDCLKNWDREIQGKITQKKLAKATGKSIKTIEKHYKHFKAYRHSINSNFKIDRNNS